MRRGRDHKGRTLSATFRHTKGRDVAGRNI
jgi:hypothetical protein